MLEAFNSVVGQFKVSQDNPEKIKVVGFDWEQNVIERYFFGK